MTPASIKHRISGAVSATLFGLIADGTSILPPRWRYAYIHPITRRLFPRQLGVLRALANASPPSSIIAQRPADIVCAIVTDKLDVGGIGAVVEMLVRGLGDFGVRPVVVCQGDGPRAQRLRELGVVVISVADGATDISAVRAARADVVQVHSAPPLLEQAAIDSGVPLIAVLHNTEIHYSRLQWSRFAILCSRASATAAVSRVVKDFHRRHLPATASDVCAIIPNGAPHRMRADHEGRSIARDLLSHAIGHDLTDAVVFVCLARYDSQKNIAGTVASFLRASATTEFPVHLVIAGEPSDWIELRRAEGIRRRSRYSDRVHLLGQSDATGLLNAGDVFLLDSFFEGWPVAASEALDAGLPLMLSDVGGAAELVASDPERSILIPNAAGPADAVTDARVGRARRRSGRQENGAQFTAAIVNLASRIVQDRADSPHMGSTVSGGSVTGMVRAHAELIRRVFLSTRL